MSYLMKVVKIILIIVGIMLAIAGGIILLELQSSEHMDTLDFVAASAITIGGLGMAFGASHL